MRTPKQDTTTRFRSWLRYAWLALCLSISGYFAVSAIASRSDDDRARLVHRPGLAHQSVTSESAALDTYVTKAIDKIRVGDRVVAKNPLLDDDERKAAKEPDPATWRHLKLRMVKGHDAQLDVELLRPATWITAKQAKPGKSIVLDLPELDAHGPAKVLSVGPCPEIQGGSGSIVTGTFAHSTGDIYDLYIEGEDECIGVTLHHQFWSEDRHTWVQASELLVGESLRTLKGPVKLSSACPRGPPQPVFNIEVSTEHVYLVGKFGSLVHNESCSPSPEQLLGIKYANKSAEASAIVIQMGQARLAKQGMSKAGIRRIDIPTRNQPGLPANAITKRGTMPHAEGRGWSVDMSGRRHDFSTKPEPIPQKAKEHLREAGWDL